MKVAGDLDQRGHRLLVLPDEDIDADVGQLRIIVGRLQLLLEVLQNAFQFPEL